MNNPATSPSAEDQARTVFGKAVDCIKKQDFAEAEKFLVDSISIFPTADATHNLGTLCFMQGNINKAVELFQKAVEIDPHYHASYANLVRIMHQKGDTHKAIEYSALAMTAAPDNKKYKQEFITLINPLRFELTNPEVKRLVQFVLEDGTLNYEYMGLAWLSLMVSDNQLAPFFNMMKHKDFASFENAFLKLSDYSALQTPYLVLGLKNLIVLDLSFERLMTNLRRLILKDHLKQKDVLFGKNFISTIAALAIYCFYTEYLFDVSDEEKSWIQELKKQLELKQDHIENPLPLCILACYEKIFTLDGANKFAGQFSEYPELKDFLTCLIDEPLTELEIKKTIKSITKLQTQTSEEVRAQYEEMSYPRWRYIPAPYGQKEFAPVQNFLPEGKVKILIAGTGTGQEALYYNRAFPDCEVLAVDLSKTSLAYGTRKLRETGKTNIDFRQGDILALGDTLEPNSFDLIVSSGVLHHMKVPEDGLASITKLLKPGGIMHLAFYSKLGRRVIMKCRDIIEENKIPNDLKSIKEFRRNAQKWLSKSEIENLLKFRDYYFLSEYRDLIFHVMEHCYDLREMDSMMKNHGLEFLAFHLNSNEVFENYAKMFPEDIQMNNLENWHKYETKYPDTFFRMYQFWVRKTAV
ncbi:MAG: methyltransferase domain-containing protein [Alphaproteobacteria bacterium]|nr:methyltransferase domain-containing protein [Alphaproteobacteria bacterium]MCB9975255.1 methyltransferase domain-containing protein [Rhodospirillales bacterium]